MNAAGSALVYSTYLGGSGTNADEGRGVAVNVVGNAYVTGVTNSANFPNTSPPPPLSTTGGIFLTKFTPSGTALAYSTRLVSGNGDFGIGVALDGAGNAFVTGTVSSDVLLNEVADPTIIGRVVDEDGMPISTATVNLTGVPAATTTTDANGYFTFGLLTVANNYTVSVSVANYIFTSQVVNNLQKNVRLDFSPGRVQHQRPGNHDRHYQSSERCDDVANRGEDTKYPDERQWQLLLRQLARWTELHGDAIKKHLDVCSN